jgi:hypothetical protein
VVNFRHFVKNILKRIFCYNSPILPEKDRQKSSQLSQTREGSCFFFSVSVFFALSIWWFGNFCDIFQLVLGVLFFRIHIEKRKISKISFVFFKVATVRKRALKEKSPPISAYMKGAKDFGYNNGINIAKSG